MAMKLDERAQALLEGKEGEVMAKVMKTLVMYGECFGAETMVPVSSRYGHLVTSFGLSVMKPIYALLDQLIDAGAVSRQAFSVDPRPLDGRVPTNVLQSLLFRVMYSKQKDYEAQLRKLGLMKEDAFSCTCYMDEVGNQPEFGEILSWAESSAVVYANSVLGARCNRNSGILELFGSIAGYVPNFGLLTDEGRRADWLVEVETSTLPPAQLLGSAIGMQVMEKVPYITGLGAWLGEELTPRVRDYLKDMGAATASNGAVGLYHVEGLTPEARKEGRKLLREGAPVYRIDDAELQRVQDKYPVIWKDLSATPKLCFIGCPHLSLTQLRDWSQRLKDACGGGKVKIPTVLTAAPGVRQAFVKTRDYEDLKSLGVEVSEICPLMYMNNPLCAKMPVITNSNKLRTYSTARFFRDEEIVKILAQGGLS